MLTIENNLQTEIVGSEDGRYTYEVRRSWGEGRKALVIELYPAVSIEKSGQWDLSAMHLMNHANELGWGEMRIINLYSTVFSCKPTVKELKSDIENITYIREIFEEEAAREYDIVIAWGSSLATHAGTIRAKAGILDMLKEKGLEKQVKHIITDSLETNGQTGTHPLYLGLRHAKEIWKLQPYPLEKVLEELKKNSTDKDVKAAEKKSKDKDVKAAERNSSIREQTTKENVSKENLSNAEEKSKTDTTDTENPDTNEEKDTAGKTKEEVKPKKGRKKDVLQNQEPA